MKENLKQRTKSFALAIIEMTALIPNHTAGRVIQGQIIKSSTSIGANYRSALRGRSKAEFISKIGIVEEEADETVYWLELLEESKIIEQEVIHPLLDEANQLTAIFTSMGKTAKSKK
ncbi:four helix bundle protein [Shivajiella indica]|uniref:Four helix bundle protein n=1 Tax=Shivajiella indica TaxID=872115 RepID=A0ABW5B720_9BACT